MEVFFIFKSKIFNLLKNDTTILEREPLEKLVDKKQLCAFVHKGFWHPMDNLRDKNNLNEMWEENKAPWKNFLNENWGYRRWFCWIGYRVLSSK